MFGSIYSLFCKAIFVVVMVEVVVVVMMVVLVVVVKVCKQGMLSHSDEEYMGECGAIYRRDVVYYTLYTIPVSINQPMVPGPNRLGTSSGRLHYLLINALILAHLHRYREDPLQRSSHVGAWTITQPRGQNQSGALFQMPGCGV